MLQTGSRPAMHIPEERANTRADWSHGPVRTSQGLSADIRPEGEGAIIKPFFGDVHFGSVGSVGVDCVGRIPSVARSTSRRLSRLIERDRETVESAAV